MAAAKHSQDRGGISRPLMKTGDTVIVISGRDRGKRGKVLRFLPKKNRVVVEGVNMMKHHMRPTQAAPQGGIIEKEAGLHISNVMYWDEDAEQPLRANKAKALKKAQKASGKK